MLYVAVLELTNLFGNLMFNLIIKYDCQCYLKQYRSINQEKHGKSKA